MYFAATTWKANFSGSEAKYGSNGSLLEVDELFKSRIMFDDIRSSKRNWTGWGRVEPTCKRKDGGLFQVVVVFRVHILHQSPNMNKIN